MELNHLPIIDWELSTKLAGNKREFAEEMISLLVKNLTTELGVIEQFYANKKHMELLHRVHRLHGTLCYCGLPRLKTVVTQLESALKSNIMIDLTSLLNQLDTEINLLLEHHSRLYT